VRRRLVLAIAGVASLAVVLFAIPLAVVIERSYRQQELLRLQRDAVAATRSIDVTGGADPVELPAGTDGLGVYDRRARRLAGVGPPAADRLVRAALRTGHPADATGSGLLLVAVPLVVGERVHGALRATRTDAKVGERAHRAWLELAGLGALLVALATGAALVLGTRLTAPLGRLAVTARRLGDGDFSARAPRAGVRELDDVAAALNTTAARLDDLVSRERAFSADASHQLRTPLASLRLELESLELRAGATEEVAAALAQVDRLQTTIDTLLAVARDTERDATADLVVLVDEVAGRWRPQLAAESRPLRVRIEARTAVVRASPAVLTEVLDVLLDNARRHGAGAVEVTVRATSGSLAVDVADEGPGLDVPDAAFSRRRAAADGHGIGLALARSLAHAEGARLVVSRAVPHPIFTVLMRPHGRTGT